MDTIRAPGAQGLNRTTQNAGNAKNHTNSTATPKQGRSGPAGSTGNAKKAQKEAENAGLTERQQRMSLSQLLGGEESGAQPQAADAGADDAKEL